jgi:hypothetical protein
LRRGLDDRMKAFMTSAHMRFEKRRQTSATLTCGLPGRGGICWILKTFV